MSHRYIPSAGLGNVGSYQVSAVPYLESEIVAPANTSSPAEVSFPGVTRWVTVRNDTSIGGTDMRFGFSALGTSGINYMRLAPQESYTGEWKITSVFVFSDSVAVATASVSAGITGIPASSLTNNWSGSSGIG